MSQIYQSRRRGQDAPAAKEFQTSVPGPSMRELAAGAMPSTEQMGHQVDLPAAIREKMESSFGADFSGVKLYESQTVADAGAQAMTMGSSVAFAPGQLDLTSTSGQALLGHELSHVVSQAKGESAGRGFLADSGLEAQADRQGMLAVRGESVFGGPVAPLSASAVPASAAGPMQASKPRNREQPLEARVQDAELHDRRAAQAAERSASFGATEERTAMFNNYGGYRDEAERKKFQNAPSDSDLSLMTFAQSASAAGHMDEEGRNQLMDASLDASNGDMSKLTPHLIQAIRQYNGTDFSRMYSASEKEELGAYQSMLDTLSLGDSLNSVGTLNYDLEGLVGRGEDKLSRKELNQFRMLYDMNRAQSMAIRNIARSDNRATLQHYRDHSDKARKAFQSGKWQSKWQNPDKFKDKYRL